MKKFIFLFLFSVCLFSIFPQIVKHNPWELLIYRPQNNGDLNEVRCWIQICNEDGTDVTYEVAKATYEWVDIPDVVNYYQKSWYLSGGMCMHLYLKSGKYQIKVYTPKDKTNLFETSNEDDWTSNTFYYNTENPAKVIFITPTANTNGFYNGGWWIDYKAPKYVKKRALPHICE